MDASVCVRLEFASAEHASIVARAVGVERERRTDIVRTFELDGGVLHVRVAAADVRKLRASVSNVLDAVHSAVDAIEQLSEEALALHA